MCPLDLNYLKTQDRPYEKRAFSKTRFLGYKKLRKAPVFMALEKASDIMEELLGAEGTNLVLFQTRLAGLTTVLINGYAADLTRQLLAHAGKGRVYMERDARPCAPASSP